MPVPKEYNNIMTKKSCEFSTPKISGTLVSVVRNV